MTRTGFPLSMYAEMHAREQIRLRRYGCCEHCEHDINDAPHDTPCPEGCADDDE